MKTEYHLEDVRESNHLREHYGDEIILLDGQDESITHRLLREFRVAGHHYAVLQPSETSSTNEEDEEILILRVVQAPSGEWELETIEDDEEWENVYELYDEMTFDLES